MATVNGDGEGQKVPDDTVSPPLAAMRQMFDLIKECVTYEEIINNAAKNQELLHKYVVQNDDLHKEIENKDISLKSLVLVHENRFTELSAEKSSLEEMVERTEGEVKELQTKTEELETDKRNYEDQLKDSSVQLEELKKKNEEIEEECSKKVKDLEEDLSKQSKDAEEQKTTAEAKIKKLRDMFSKTSASLKALEQKHESLHKKGEKTEAQLATCQKKLSVWEGYKSGLNEEPLENIASEIHKLCYQTHALAQKYFLMNLPISFKQQKADNLLEKLNEIPALANVSFVPTSDSEPAKDFRTALAFSVLTNLIMKHVFRPTFVGQNQLLQMLLSEQARTDSKKELLCRALILSLSEEDEDLTTLDSSRFTAEVADNLHPMLATDQKDFFDEELDALMAQARTLWSLIQHNVVRIEAVIYEEGDYDKWKTLQINSTNVEGTIQDLPPSENPAEDPVEFVLFPAFYSISEGKENEYFYAGYALRGSQVSEIQLEMEHNTRTVGRMGFPRRKMSNVEASSPGFASGLPTPPAV
ncbi:hypothetical protein AAFC00_004444 [Neodothiora populina]|uniref:Uncharacterized protein n=1 Tax=Neodothiora populina TaxID=2781224 RepID=A0ABR3P202_9PEZI